MLLGMRSFVGGGGPALYLPFALTGTLDPRITFSRPSLATMYDSTGKLTFAPNNLLQQSATPANIVWGKSNVSVSGNDVTLTGSPGAFQYIQQSYPSTPSSGDTYIWAVKMSGTGTITLDSNGFTGNATCTLTSTPTWFFVKLTYSSGAAAARVISYPGNTASTFTLHDASLSRVTYETGIRSRDQVTTTSAAYYGPRFDYNPATLVARGLLIEEARTNICLRSEDFTTTWSVSNATITANSIVSPDGVATADTWTSGGTSYPSVFQTITVTNGIAYTASFFAKAGTSSSIQAELRGAAGGTPDGTFDLSTGVATVAPGATGSPVVSMVSVGNGWYRCTVTKTSTSTSFIFIIGQFTSVIGNTVYLYGAQLEAGSFATSYIPTAASAVARSADSATMTGTNFSSWYNQAQGTFVVNYEPTQVAAGNPYPMGVYVPGLAAFSGPRISGSVWNSSGGALTFSPTTNNTNPHKIAVGYIAGANASATSVDGSAVTPGTNTPPTVNAMGIGTLEGPTYILNGWVKLITYYNTRLPDATLQSLTLPVIADYYFLVDANGDQLTDASGNPLYTQPLYL